jgi:hypothetical protein
VQNEPNFARPGAVAGGQMRKTNPIWPRRTGGAGTGGVRREVPSVRSGRSSMPPSYFKVQTSNFTLPNGKCAKRSQTWGDWSIWAKAVVVSVVARPGSETCKTNPISKCQVFSLKFQAAGRRGQTGHALTSNCTLHTSNSPGNALRRHCKRAKQSQSVESGNGANCR